MKLATKRLSDVPLPLTSRPPLGACGMRHGRQPVMSLAEVHRLGCDHDPDGLIREDHSAFLNAAARSRLQSGATCRTAPQISTLITPVPPTAAVSKIDGSIISGTNAGAASIGTTSSPLCA